MSFTSASGATESCWRDVWVVAVARGASMGGDLLTATALLLTLQGRGQGGVTVAAVLIAASAPLVLLAPVSGRLVDRVDSRLLLTVVGLAQAACCAVMAYAQSTPVLVAMVAVVAAGASVTQPTFAALVPDMVRREDVPRATAMMQTASSVGMLAGPPVAGLLVGAFGLEIPLLLNGATFVGISLAGLLIATRRRPASAVATGDEPAQPPPARWSMWRDGLLLPMVVMTGLVVAVASAINVVDVFFIRETLHASATGYGLTGAVWTGALMLGSWLVARRRTDDAGYALLMAGALAAMCAAIGAAGLVPHVGWLLPLFVVGGAGNGASNSIAAVLISRRAPAPVRGRAFGYLGAVANAANIGGFVAGGILVDRFAPAALLVASGVLGVGFVAVCMLPMVRAARRERDRADDTSAAVTTV